ncbi:methionine synthase reductase-like [Hyalella azteca]|uniref:Methionine synthase reductase n=1 Tax=Hyalella azteca TaxID=294128 RepID=A0A979FL56_HYAAZ|nr:methionine synthase reductase-like [Hyalella azteca]
MNIMYPTKLRFRMHSKNHISLFVVYASQQGNAQAIAQDLHEELEEHLKNKNVTTAVKCISDFGEDPSLFSQCDCIIFIASTTGDGDPPDTAKKLWRVLNKCSKALNVDHLTYTVLGLGDTNYTNFCNFGKNLDKILHKLGAKRFYPCGWADDGTDLEIVIEPWKETLWAAISQHVSELAMHKTLPDKDSNMTHFSASVAKASLTEFDIPPSHERQPREREDECDSDVISKLDELCVDDIDLCSECHPLLRLELASDRKLVLPKIPTLDAIIINISNEIYSAELPNKYQNGALLPSAQSDTIECDILKFRSLSSETPGKAVKKVAELILQPPAACENDLKYEPGDSVAVLTYNNEHDVNIVLEKLSVTKPDNKCSLERNPESKKPLPTHLPVCSSLREIFTSCVEIRCVPKKAVLLQFLKCCSDPHESRCLQELVSREGSEFYIKKVVEDRITFIDLLCAFPSCKLQVSTLLEVLPRLLPRAYSLTSTPLSSTHYLSFAYSLAIIPKSAVRMEERKGVCTGLFDSLNSAHVDGDKTRKLSLYLRSSQAFRLPGDPTRPIIMVGPGTGVAPFIGFLRHREQQLQMGMLDLTTMGETWLFFGCRFRDADELFKEEIQHFVNTKILTHFHQCFSREYSRSNFGRQMQPRYVQDLLECHSARLTSAIADEKAIIYVCGDASKMAKEVHSTFSSLLAKHFGDETQASEYLSQMQKDKRYMQDVWT